MYIFVYLVYFGQTKIPSSSNEDKLILKVWGVCLFVFIEALSSAMGAFTFDTMKV